MHETCRTQEVTISILVKMCLVVFRIDDLVENVAMKTTMFTALVFDQSHSAHFCNKIKILNRKF